jgi:hypothetical protein
LFWLALLLPLLLSLSVLVVGAFVFSVFVGVDTFVAVLVLWGCGVLERGNVWTILCYYQLYLKTLRMPALPSQSSSCIHLRQTIRLTSRVFPLLSLGGVAAASGGSMLLVVVAAVGVVFCVDSGGGGLSAVVFGD